MNLMKIAIKDRSRMIGLVATVTCLFLAGGCSKESKKARHLESAERYFAENDYRRAEIEYQNVLRLDFTNALAIKRLGHIYFQRGETGRAFGALRAAAQMDPNDADVNLKLGLCYLVGGSNTVARTYALKVLAKDPGQEEAFLLLADTVANTNDARAMIRQIEGMRPQAGAQSGFHTALGNLHFGLRDVKTAESCYEQALKLDPKASGALAAMARLRASQTNMAEAESLLKAAAEAAPARSSRRLAYADYLKQVGNDAAAKAYLEDITKQAPDFSPAWLRLAEFALEENKPKDAESFAGRVLAQEPRNQDAMLISAQVNLMQGDRAGALAEFEKVAQAHPRSAVAHYHLARALIANGDDAKAITSLRQAITLQPGFAKAILFLAELNTARGDTAASVSLLTDLVKKQPGLFLAHLALANAYNTQKNYDASLAIYRMLSEKFPKNPRSPYLMGMVLREQNKPIEARAALEKALALATNDLGIVQQLVSLDLAEKRYAEATQRVRALSAIAPKAAAPHLLLARIHLAQGQTNQAEAALQTAIELAPDATGAYFQLSQIYFSSGKQSQAKEKLQAIVKKNPKDVPALMLIAMIEDGARNYQASRNAYEQILSIDPQFGPALNNLAFIYSEHLNQPEKAYERAVQARKAQPQDANTADTLGWILYKRGDYPAAISLLQESADKLRTQAEVLYHLAMARYMMGDEEAARDGFQRAQALNQEFPGQDEARRCLNVLGLDPAKSDEKITQALEERLDHQQPGDPVALNRLVAIYRRTNAEDKAVRVAEKALKTNPKSARIAILLAELCARQPQGQEKALDLAKRARTLAPEDGQIAQRLGRLAYQMGDYRWALSLFQESVRNAPLNPELLYDLGLTSYVIGRAAEADTAMQDLLKANPATPQADRAKRFLTMSALVRKPETSPASVAQVQQALQAEPDLAPAALAAGMIYEAQGKLPEARQTYEKLVARFPLLAPAVRRLALLTADVTTDDQKVYDLAQKAREMYPDDPEVARVAGMAAYRHRDFTRAAQLLKESLTRGPANADAHFQLGMACKELKRVPEARENLNKALALNPNGKFASQAKEVLAQLK